MTDTSTNATGTESWEAVAAWAADLLEVAEVAPADNFLDLGGHSMLAVELAERVKDRFGAEVDMQTLFEGTLGDLAAQVHTHAQSHPRRTVEAGSMSDSFALTEEQLAQFERDGYLGPIKIYEVEEMEERWTTIQRQLRDRSMAIYPENGGKASSISNYDRHLDIDLLSEHIMKREIVDRLTSILGPNVLCWRSEFFPKFQGDEGTDWHQAATFAHASGTPQIVWPSEDGMPAFGGTITVWTAFTHSTKENGCLQLMPGTHKHMNYDESKGMEYNADAFNQREKDGVKRGFFGYDYRQLQNDPDWKPDESQAFPLVMKPGECVIFWSTLMHASLPHTGTKKDYRMGYAARFVPTQVQVYPNTDSVTEYGGGIVLDKYGTVLVAGVDEYKHNRVATENQRGFVFKPND